MASAHASPVHPDARVGSRDVSRIAASAAELRKDWTVGS